ncbi:hypothetical protein ACFL6P_09970 [Candidatus Latescibacterota bacterium]
MAHEQEFAPVVKSDICPIRMSLIMKTKNKEVMMKRKILYVIMGILSFILSGSSAAQTPYPYVIGYRNIHATAVDGLDATIQFNDKELIYSMWTASRVPGLYASISGSVLGFLGKQDIEPRDLSFAMKFIPYKTEKGLQIAGGLGNVPQGMSGFISATVLTSWFKISAANEIIWEKVGNNYKNGWSFHIQGKILPSLFIESRYRPDVNYKNDDCYDAAIRYSLTEYYGLFVRADNIGAVRRDIVRFVGFSYVLSEN